MTIANETNKSGPYFYNGAATSFAYGFKIPSETHIRVVETVIATGVESDLVLNTDYTVTGVGNDTGSIVISPARAAGKTATLVRNPPFTQQLDLENQGAYFADAVEAAFDLAVARDQKMQEQITRSVKVPVSSDLDPDELIADLTAGSAAAVAAAVSAAANAALTAADRVQTGLDRAQTVADRVSTTASAVATAADRVQTGLDRTSVTTNKGLVDTAKAAVDVAKAAADADVVLTHADVVLTHADVVLTHADAVATAADRVQTGLDRVAAAASAASVGFTITALSGRLNGLILSNNASDATNDLDILAGSAVDIAATRAMVLASSITKRLDAAWAVGTNQGGLDTGSKANSTWYFAFLIQRPDTGVVDVLYSTSPTAPVMPTNYTVKRRLRGAFKTDGAGAIIPFKQNGGWTHFLNAFEMAAGTVNLATNVAQSIYIEMPIGIKVLADFVFLAQATSVASFLSICDPDLGAAGSLDMVGALNTTTLYVAQMQCFTDTTGKVSVMNNAAGTFRVFVRGWFDPMDI